MTASFIIHADVDGYLDDPALGPVNEMIYDTIIEISKPNTAENRPYPLRQPPVAIFMEAYSLMNDFAEESHPEENCVLYHFPKVRERIIDTYAAEVVLSVVFVLLRLQRTKKSRRLISVIKSNIDANSGYFKAFEEVADDLEKLGYYVSDPTSPHPAEDWQAKYLLLQEQYLSLLSVYQSATEGTQLEMFPAIPPASKEAAKNGIVLISDLLDAVVEANTTDIFEVLKYSVAKTSGNMSDLIKIREKLFRANANNQYDSNLAFNEQFDKIDLIRVFLAIFHLLVKPRVGKKLTVKEYFDIIGKVFDYDFGNVTKYYSESLGSGCSPKTIKAIFELLGQNLVNVYDKLKAKK
jgi:hypothetical protein